MGDGQQGIRLLSNRTIAVAAAALLVVAATACWVLPAVYGSGTDADKARLETVRTVGTIVLGAEKAPVRLAGLYALERLAQDNPAHRQTLVNVISAYRACRTSRRPTTRNLRGCLEEREVRMTAPQILTGHLAPGGSEPDRFSLRNANFARARFLGQTFLLGIEFRRNTTFDDARFGKTNFAGKVIFSEDARFVDCTLDGVPYTPPEWKPRPEYDDFG